MPDTHYAATLLEYDEPVRSRLGRVKRYQRRYLLRCSCGAELGSRLDYIDLRRAWREHCRQARGGRDD